MEVDSVAFETQGMIFDNFLSSQTSPSWGMISDNFLSKYIDQLEVYDKQDATKLTTI